MTQNHKTYFLNQIISTTAYANRRLQTRVVAELLNCWGNAHIPTSIKKDRSYSYIHPSKYSENIASWTPEKPPVSVWKRRGADWSCTGWTVGKSKGILFLFFIVMFMFMLMLMLVFLLLFLVLMVVMVMMITMFGGVWFLTKHREWSCWDRVHVHLSWRLLFT